MYHDLNCSLSIQLNTLTTSLSNIFSNTTSFIKYSLKSSYDVSDNILTYNDIRLSFGGAGFFINTRILTWYSSSIYQAGTYVISPRPNKISITLSTDGLSAKIKADQEIKLRIVTGVKEGCK